MPRPRMFRRVLSDPSVFYFKPSGIGLRELQEIVLLSDEYESVRLTDLLGKEQTEAAKEMQISQPTFHRILKSARSKISDAIINGKAIKVSKLQKDRF